VGAYQFFTVLGLTLFGVEKTLATGFSVVAFVILTLPLLALGLTAITHAGISVSSLRTNMAAKYREQIVPEGC
jgi:hypothetical protein